jgi:hypothetical protein
VLDARGSPVDDANVKGAEAGGVAPNSKRGGNTDEASAAAVEVEEDANEAEVLEGVNAKSSSLGGKACKAGVSL